jgi:hypothetical protein
MAIQPEPIALQGAMRKIEEALSERKMLESEIKQTARSNR